MHTDILTHLAACNFSVDVEALQKLPAHEKLKILKDLSEIASCFNSEEKKSCDFIEPLSQVVTKKTSHSELRTLIEKGEVAFVFMAGGQSTRFQELGWKGTYPVFQGKSVIELLLDKLKLKNLSKEIEVAFVVSQDTKELVQNHLEKLGTKYEMVVQHSWPVFTMERTLYLENGLASFVPAGNGQTLQHLQREGVMEKWEKLGIKYIACVVIDNPLIDLADADFWSEVEKMAPDIALKVFERKPFESFGALCKKNNRIEILEAAWFRSAAPEYSEKEKKYPWGNSGFIVFSLPFCKKNFHQKLPLHLIEKNDSRHGSHLRFEQFLTDYLAFTDNTLCYEINREEEFAPLKNPNDLGPIQKKISKC